MQVESKTENFLIPKTRINSTDQPVKNEMRAAAKPLFRSTESWPFTRDWMATTTPINTAKIANIYPQILINTRNFSAINRLTICQVGIVDFGWFW